MHFVNSMAALAVASTAIAANVPSRVERRAATSSSSGALPTITVSGNGESRAGSAIAVTTNNQLTTPQSFLRR